MHYHQHGFEVTPEILKLIAEMAENRYTQPMIAKSLGLGIQKWYKLKAEHPEIKLIMQNAKIMLIDHVKTHLIKIIDDPKHPKHYSALVWFLSRYDPDARLDANITPEAQDSNLTEEELLAKIQELAKKTFRQS